MFSHQWRERSLKTESVVLYIWMRWRFGYGSTTKWFRRVYRFPNSQWKSPRTTKGIERLNGVFHRSRSEDSGFLPSAQAAELLLFDVIISGKIRLRRIDGWRDLKQVTLSL